MNRPSVVIKVKHGKTLRRFSAFVNEDQQLDLDMGRLRTKICSLFNFSPDADFTLTYVDEDDDQVTLADDEDLHDVMRQGLNPVRITVCLNAEKSAESSSTKSTGSPSSSSQNSQGKNPHVIGNEILNSVPVHLSDALSKLSHELASKAAITSPVLGEVISSLSKVGESLLNASQSPSGTATASTNEVHADQQNTSATENHSASAGVGEKSGGVEGSTSGLSNSTTEGAKQAEPVKPAQQPPFVLHKGKNANPGYCHYMPMGDVNNKDKGVTADPAWKFFGDSRKKDKEIKGDSAEGARFNVFESVRAQMEKNLKLGKETSSGENKEFNWGGSSGKSAVNPFVMDTCPFSGLPMQSPVSSAPYMPPPIQHFKRSYNDSADGVGSIFHKGVRCDGCGVLPITGPRFKSKVKHNYDLCSICFSRMGNAADYARIDFPLPYRHPWTFKGFHEPTGLPHIPPLLRPYGSKHHRSRLDSRFITDVNVMDGTLMPPSTPFTKIWRMRNNGTLPWTRGLQLLWIGGDRFSSSDSFEIEIPVGGVNVGNEIDVAVDFIAPELPGRYISYWRMADATGHKFGQRVWVLIQVDASLRDTEVESSPVFKSGEPSESPDTSTSAHESSPVVDLNLPPENATGFSVEENPSAENLNLNENVDPVGDLEAGNLNSAPDECKSSPSVTEQQTRKVEMLDMNFPINDDLLINNDGSSSSSSSSSSSNPPPVIAGNPPSLAVASAPFYPELGIPTIIQQKPPSEASSPNTPASSSSVQYPDSAADAASLPIPFRFFYPGGNVSARSPPVSPSPSTVSYPTIDMPQPTPPTISYPIIDMSEKSSISSSSAAAGGDDSDKKADDQVTGVVNEVEENLLKELAEMGFKQVELNKEVLRQNEYDLQRSVDELCGVHEWDPILEELKEMGFQDKETNRRLLVKNNGSIMRVVMDLIAGEKA